MEVQFHHVGVATVVFTVGDVTSINDPCFDESGGWYHHGYGAFSKKTGDPRFDPGELPEPDVGFVTHGHHYDNLDDSGRELLQSVPNVVSTRYSAGGLNGSTGLEPGESTSFTVDGTDLTVRAVNARHGLGPLAWLTGPVNGYVIELGEKPFRIYVSGDTVFTNDIGREVNRHGPVDLFLPHLGRAYFPYLSGPLRYTMNGDDLLEFLDTLKPTYTYPIHNEGWTHFRPVDVTNLKNVQNHTELVTDPECTIKVQG